MPLHDLDETRWRIVRVRSGDELEPTIDAGEGTEFTFLGDGRFGGSTGCNRFFGQFTDENGTLSAGPVGITMMMCPDDRMAQERSVLAAIETTTAIRKEVHGVTFLDTAGEVVMELEGFGAPEPRSPGALSPELSRGL